MASGPDPDNLRYAQAKRWFPRTKTLTADPELAVTATDMTLEDCGDVKEILLIAVTGNCQVSNRSDGTYKTILEGSSFLIPCDAANEYVWIKGAGVVVDVIALGFNLPKKR